MSKVRWGHQRHVSRYRRKPGQFLVNRLPELPCKQPVQADFSRSQRSRNIQRARFRGANLPGDPHKLAAMLPKGVALDIPGRDHNLAVGDKVYKQGVLEFLAVRP